MPASKISRAEIDEYAKMLRVGHTQADVARKFGRHKDSIRRALARSGYTDLLTTTQQANIERRNRLQKSASRHSAIRTGQEQWRQCLKCDGPFVSRSADNRLCGNCRHKIGVGR